MKKKLAIVVVLVMAFALVSGCGSEKTVKTDDGKVKYEEGKATFEGNDGSKTEVNVATDENKEVSLPDGYPKDLVPIIDGSQIQMANKNEADGKISYMVSLSNKKSPKDVYNFYKDVLKDGQNLYNTETPDLYSIAGEKNNQQIGVTITADEGKSSVQIIVTPK